MLFQRLDLKGYFAALALIGALAAPSARAEARQELQAAVRALAAVNAPAPPCPCVSAMADRVVPHDFSHFDDLHSLGPNGSPKLWAVADRIEDFHPERQPLVLVHGWGSTPASLQAIIDRYRDRYQVYVLAYDSTGMRTSQNGSGFASELRWLRDNVIGQHRDMNVVCHSLGGMVCESALDDLALDRTNGASTFGVINATPVDTPFHGFPGQGDRGMEGVLTAIARPLLPDGAEDMRARSDYFRGNRKTRTHGVFDVSMPDNIRISPVFATNGSEATDYTEGEMTELPARIVRMYRDRLWEPGSSQLENLWHALLNSRAGHRFSVDMIHLKDQGKLTEDNVRTKLLERFPRFEGDHSSVVSSPAFLDYLQNHWDGTDPRDQ